jgi:hypothetical protein
MEILKAMLGFLFFIVLVIAMIPINLIKYVIKRGEK